MKKAVRMAVAAGMCAALALSAGCQKKTVADDEVQRYAWPLATASPEDTVTQIYAEKFAEEVEELSIGKMKYPGLVRTVRSEGTESFWRAVYTWDIPFVIQKYRTAGNPCRLQWCLIFRAASVRLMKYVKR